MPEQGLEAFYASVDARVAQLTERHAARLNCRKGCSACCVDDIRVFEVEAAHIRAKHAPLLANATPHETGACAFLDADGACRIYADRPYVCRTHGLPLAWVEERETPDGEGEFVELRDICHLNEAGEPLEALEPQECWRIGTAEDQLRKLEEQHSGAPKARVALRSLFGHAPVCQGHSERGFARAWAAIETGDSVREALEAAALSGADRARVREALRLALHQEGRVRASMLRLRPEHWPRALHIGSLVFSGLLPVAKAGEHCPAVDWPAALRRDAERQADPDPARALAQATSIPPFLATRLLEEYGEEAARLVRGWQQRAPWCLRANTLHTTRDGLQTALAARGLRTSPGAFGPDALTLASEVELHRLPEFENGWLELQDEASQLIVELLAVPARGLVIDWCAGAGGKTLAIGARMQNRGRLLALDRNNRRLSELKKRAARARLQNFSCFQTPRDGFPLVPELERALGKADRVLVDAPCSGLGSLRRKPELLRKLDAATLERLPREQLEIARAAARYVKPGGRLIYATCTLLRAENEGVVERLLAEDGFRLIPAREVLGGVLGMKLSGEDGRYLRTYPHRHGTDGFFSAVLEKR